MAIEMVRKLKVEEAVGHRLAHDVVQYGPNLKAVIFKRGHLIRAEDIERLKDSGNYYVYVEGGEEQGIHEDEAAIRLMRAAAGKNVFLSRPNKGRVDAFASIPGILRVNVSLLREINSIDGFILVSRKDYSLVGKSELVASGKIVPLFISEIELRRVEKTLRSQTPGIEIFPPQKRAVCAIITGTEVYEGRVKDGFVPAINTRLEKVGLRLSKICYVPDDVEQIKSAILDSVKTADIVLVGGGMAVDAGDVTPEAIKATGAKVVSRGIPVFPGAMLMVAYLDSIPILGLPACVIPDRLTSFDLLLPKLLLGEPITKAMIIELAHGGLL